MARGRFVLSPEVEEVLGPKGVRQLAEVETFTCVCGQRARTDAEPVSVYVETDQVEGGPPMFRVGFAHARCRPSRVVRRQGMIGELLAAPAGGAMAYFRTRERRPRAVLIWSPYLRMTAVSAPGKLHVDRWLMAHLEAGFRPVRASLDEAALPPVEGWSLLLTTSLLRLNDPRRGAAYEQERDTGIEPWVEVATAEGSWLAVTGSGLADTLADGNWAAIAEAQRGERLVGGVVHVVQE